jgi:hypothetical protein
MAASPDVTIGIPAYNGASHLAEAIESARAQEYAPLEIVIVDDASTDETEAICRRLGDADPRIRYMRRERNAGAVPNFWSVLSQSRSKYFTWLAQDDLIADPRYVTLMVEYLERHPDVVACTSDFVILDHEYPGSRAIVELAELRPDRPWPRARQELFRWPQTSVSRAIYSMYRREALDQIPKIVRRYRGRSTSAWWEMTVLTALSGWGRIVAIPGCQREKRSLTTSDGWRTYQRASPFDLSVLGLQIRLLVLRIGCQLPVPFPERIALIKLALENFSRANFRRPLDIPALIDTRRQELETLRRTMNERAQLIARLEGEIAQRRAASTHSTPGPASGPDTTGDSDGVAPRSETGISSELERALDRYDRAAGSFWDFFRPAPDWILALCERLNDEIGDYRRRCDEQLRDIEDLSAAAEALLRHAPPQKASA